MTNVTNGTVEVQSSECRVQGGPGRPPAGSGAVRIYAKGGCLFGAVHDLGGGECGEGEPGARKAGGDGAGGGAAVARKGKRISSDGGPGALEEKGRAEGKTATE